MTTFIDFTPSNVSVPQFQATLDGALYNVTVTWNLAGQRYYVNIYDQSGTLVVALPQIGSPVGVALAGLRCFQGTVTATCAVPHSFQVGTTVSVTVSGAVPTDYNGAFQALVINSTQLTYSIATLPLASSVPGNLAYNVSLTAGYFASTLVWRPANNQFEVSP